MIAAALALMLAGVAPSASSGPTHPEGHWVSDCLPIGKDGRHGFIVRIDVEGGALVGAAQMYATFRCDVPTFKMD